MDWKLVAFDAAEMEAGAGDRLLQGFRDVFLAANAPDGAALYRVQWQRNTPYQYFFSPEAARLAATLLKDYSASSCSEPHVPSLEMLVGNTNIGKRG